MILKKMMPFSLSLSMIANAVCVAGSVSQETTGDFIRLEGRIGEKARLCFDARVFSDEAHGPIYNEAVNAFRTHFDDDTNRVVRSKDYDWLKSTYGGWQGEYWGKSMLSACAVLEQTGKVDLMSWFGNRAEEFVAEFQQEDGYLSTYVDRHFLGGPRDKRNAFCWNIWGRKYTVWALLELSRLCDRPKLLAAACRIIDNEVATLKALGLRFAETGYFAGLPSSSTLVPLMKLYHVTGEVRYLDAAREIVADWERPDGRRPNLIRNARSGRFVADWYEDTDWAKAYEMMSCLEGLVDFALTEKRPDLLQTVVSLRDLIAKDELNVMDSVGEFDHFRHARGKKIHRTELCDVIHWIRLNKSLYLATGDRRCLDYVERAFLNAFLAGVWRNGRWCAHEVRAAGDSHWAAPAQTGMFRHQCCVDNAPRGFVDFASLAVIRRKDCFEVNFQEPFEATVDGVRFRMSGDYPYSEASELQVDTGARTVRVRVLCGGRSDDYEVSGRRQIPLRSPLLQTEESFAAGTCTRRGPVLLAHTVEVTGCSTNVLGTCPFSEVADCEHPIAPFTVWHMPRKTDVP